jgi:hypothetical protein
MTNHPQALKIDGPFTHSNLSLYLLTLPETQTVTGSQYLLPLDRAIREQTVIVHETGQVGRLEVENLSTDMDVLIQDGDIVRGGRQDRVVRIDFILPAKSGRLPLPTFCVEKRRWGRRGAEAAHMFSGASHVLSARSMRASMRAGQANQMWMWDEVSKLQGKLSASIGEEVAAKSSPSSMDLSLDHKALERRRAEVRRELGGLRSAYPEATGLIVAMNGRIAGGDLYFNSELFGQLWERLLDAAANESVGELLQFTKTQLERLPTASALAEAVQKGLKLEEKELHELPPRTRITLRRGQTQRVFTTRDAGRAGEPVRTAIEFLQS